jgi:hypothetical protein
MQTTYHIEYKPGIDGYVAETHDAKCRRICPVCHERIEVGHVARVRVVCGHCILSGAAFK